MSRSEYGFLTIEELRQKMKCSKTHIKNMVKEGLPHHKCGKLIRYDWEAVKDYTRVNVEISDVLEGCNERISIRLHAA